MQALQGKVTESAKKLLDCDHQTSSIARRFFSTERNCIWENWIQNGDNVGCVTYNFTQMTAAMTAYETKKDSPFVGYFITCWRFISCVALGLRHHAVSVSQAKEVCIQ